MGQPASLRAKWCVGWAIDCSPHKLCGAGWASL